MIVSANISIKTRVAPLTQVTTMIVSANISIKTRNAPLTQVTSQLSYISPVVAKPPSGSNSFLSGPNMHVMEPAGSIILSSNKNPTENSPSN